MICLICHRLNRTTVDRAAASPVMDSQAPGWQHCRWHLGMSGLVRGFRDTDQKPALDNVSACPVRRPVPRAAIGLNRCRWRLPKTSVYAWRWRVGHITTRPAGLSYLILPSSVMTTARESLAIPTNVHCSVAAPLLYMHFSPAFDGWRRAWIGGAWAGTPDGAGWVRTSIRGACAGRLVVGARAFRLSREAP